MREPKELEGYFMRSNQGKGNYLPLIDFITEIQKESYNQAIEDSKLKIKYDFRETTVDTPTNNASYCSRSEMFMDFMNNYEDSILKLKIK